MLQKPAKSPVILHEPPGVTTSHSQGELLLPWHLGTGLRRGGWPWVQLGCLQTEVGPTKTNLLTRRVSQENNAKQLSCTSLVQIPHFSLLFFLGDSSSPFW